MYIIRGYIISMQMIVRKESFCLQLKNIFVVSYKRLSINDPDLLRTLKICGREFPESSRLKLAYLEDLFLTPSFKFYTIYYNQIVAGVFTTWEFNDFLFVEYFVIDKHFRGLGVGSDFMKQFLPTIHKKVVLEVEPPHTKTAKQRIDFYKRLGFRICPRHYDQPPYDNETDWVAMMLMSYPEPIGPGEFEHLKKNIYRKVYNLSDYVTF